MTVKPWRMNCSSTRATSAVSGTDSTNFVSTPRVLSRYWRARSCWEVHPAAPPRPPPPSLGMASAVHVYPERPRHLLSHVPKSVRRRRVKDDRVARPQVVLGLADLDAQAAGKHQAELPAGVMEGAVGETE